MRVVFPCRKLCPRRHQFAPPPPPLSPTPPPNHQLDVLLGKVGDWGYDTLALEEATSGHALSVLGFMLVTRTEVFKKFRLDKGRLAR